MATRKKTKSETGSALTVRELGALSRTLSDPRRFQILQQVASQPCVACSDLRAALPITAATLSHHLKELESCGLIETSRRGKFVDAVFVATPGKPTWLN